MTAPGNPRLVAALELARSGFRVFPLQNNSKEPSIRNWQNLATTDVDQINQWWSWYQGNIAILTDGLCVVDVDPRNGGDDEWCLLRFEHGTVETVTSLTQGGGQHLIYRTPPGDTIGNSKSKLGRGIDVKAQGGYIVAPGSEIDGRPYKWAKDCSPTERPIAPVPEWILKTAKARLPRGVAAGKRVVEEDDEAVRMAEHYIVGQAPWAEEGQRNDTAFHVAAHLFDFGVSENTAWEKLYTWNITKCAPPLSDEELEGRLKSAQKNRSRAIGSRHPNAPGLEAVEIGPKKLTPIIGHANGKDNNGLRRVEVESFAVAAAKACILAEDPLIKGVIERKTMSVLYGESGAGKSFIALDMAFHIAAGLPWNGHQVRQGAVLYVATEGGRGIYKRLGVLRHKHPDVAGVHFYLIKTQVDLLHGQKDVESIVSAANVAAKEAGVALELIVLDTLSRALAGGDENSPTDMGEFVKSADRIRTASDAHLMLIHHTGKDKAKGARGHSLLRAATDTEIEVNDNFMRATKQRDIDDDLEMHYRLTPVGIGETADGQRVSSCMVDWRSAREAASDPMPLSQELAELKEALIWELLGRDGVTEENLKHYRWGWQDIEALDIEKFHLSGRIKVLNKERTIRRLADKLASSGHVKKVGRNQWVIIDPDNPDKPDI